MKTIKKPASPWNHLTNGQPRTRIIKLWSDCRYAPIFQTARQKLNDDLLTINRTLHHKYHVTVVLEDRAYGGSEEGGWWYDTTEPEHDHPLNNWFYDHAEARQYAEAVRTILDLTDNKGRRDISSVLSEGRYNAIVTLDGPADYDPQRRPYYC